MLQDIIKKRVLVLDGAMGTMIQQYGLNEADFRGARFKNVSGLMAGNNDLLCLTRPDVVRDIHRKYLNAGADIIETNTFSAQRISMSDYHVEDCCREINLEACKIARAEADAFTAMTPDKPRFVAGSIGPTNKTCSMSPDVNNPALRTLTFDELAAAYQEQMEALIEGGVDALLIETIFDTLNAKAALWAAEEAMTKMGRKVPIMLSVTVSDKSGRTLSGQTIKAFMTSIAHANVFSVGLNCSFGARDLMPFVRELSQISPYYISVYPNAGLPNSLGAYDQTPEEMAEEMRTIVDEGLVNIIGGCCGTTDEYIARFQTLSEQATPYIPKSQLEKLTLSGLDNFVLTPEIRFVNVGERCNVAGSRKFLRLIKGQQYDEALEIARQQVDDGAMVIDVNMDDGLLDTAKEMRTFLNLIASEPEIARVPIMIDSSDWSVILAGLKCVQGKCIVNSLSLKEGEKVFVERAREVKRLGAALIVMAFDEKGQADTFERKIEVCERAYKLLTQEVHFNPNDIIFDPNILAIATGMPEHDSYAVDFIKATAWIRQNLPGAHVSGGVSNLSFALRGNNYIREAMHAVFLYHACHAGMDMGIVNPATNVMYGDIPEETLRVIEDVVLNRERGAAEHLIALADKMKTDAQNAGGGGDSLTVKSELWRQGSIEERLIYALQKGIETYLQEDLEEAVVHYKRVVDIIEGPLMDGMKMVGKLFGDGKMFLPQVVKTARTMKKAVSILQPRLEAEKERNVTSRGLVLLATVKGDVHDIGKNIVSVVMACNNYEVVDLGVMTPTELIVAKAKELQPDLIGLSGLITPSLEEMVNVCKELRRAGINVPVMIGGATTSPLHTALKIAPVYDGPVVWMKDASQNALVASKLLNKETAEETIAQIKKEQEELRQGVRREPELLSLQEARDRKLRLFE